MIVAATRLPSAIEDREVRGADAAARVADVPPATQSLGVARSRRIEARSPGSVVRAEEPLDRHRHERRIAEIFRAVAMHAAQALDDHVLAGRAVELCKIVAVEDVERVDARQRRRMTAVARSRCARRDTHRSAAVARSGGSSPGLPATRCRRACALLPPAFRRKAPCRSHPDPSLQPHAE